MVRSVRDVPQFDLGTITFERCSISSGAARREAKSPETVRRGPISLLQAPIEFQRVQWAHREAWWRVSELYGTRNGKRTRLRRQVVTSRIVGRSFVLYRPLIRQPLPPPRYEDSPSPLGIVCIYTTGARLDIAQMPPA